MRPEWKTDPIVIGRASCESLILPLSSKDIVRDIVVVFPLFGPVDNRFAWY